jgi:hypothetical protein
MNDSTSLKRDLALVHALYERTKDGKIDWKAAHAGPGFETDFGDYVLRIHERLDENYPDDPDYFLDVIRKAELPDSIRDHVIHNDVIETISNISLRPVMDRLSEDGLAPRTLLEQIYTMARRRVLGVDDALDVILESLRHT